MEQEKNYLEGIKLVSFDIWQTLLLSNPKYKFARAQALRSHLGAETIDLVSFSQLMKAIDDEVDKISDTTGAQFGLAERVQKIYERLPVGQKFEELSDVHIRAFEAIADKLIVNNLPGLLEKDLLSTLSAIKNKGIKIAVISNTGFISGRQMRLVLSQLGILPFLSIQLFSNEVGVSKPNKLIFEALVEKSGIDGSMIIHVGDNYKADYIGARSAGLQAIQLTTDTDTDSIKIGKIAELIK